MNGCGSICHPRVDSTRIPSLAKFRLRSKIKPEVEKPLREPGVVKGCQHRFRQGRLCSANLLEPFEDITAVTSQRNPMLILQALFPKAFGKKSASEMKGQESQARGKNRAQEPGAAGKEQEFHCAFAQPCPSPGAAPSPPWNSAFVG